MTQHPVKGGLLVLVSSAWAVWAIIFSPLWSLPLHLYSGWEENCFNKWKKLCFIYIASIALVTSTAKLLLISYMIWGWSTVLIIRTMANELYERGVTPIYCDSSMNAKKTKKQKNKQEKLTKWKDMIYPKP